MINPKHTIPSSSGVAARLKQKREADLDRMERDKQFPVIFVKSYGFRPYFSNHDSVNISGPLCPGSLSKDRQCLAELSGDSIESNNAHCDVCGRTYDMPHGFQEFRTIAHKAYDGFVNSQAELITLDVPYEAIKAESEDETRKIKVVWSQKDGRNQAVIYLIKKGESKGEKAQVFADISREEIRYDSGDIHPEEFLAKITAEFQKTNVEIEYAKKQTIKNESDAF